MLFVVIQARMTSTRLPGKVLKELCGMSVLEVMFERLNKYRENIIVATTNDGTEKAIVEVCKKRNINYFQGDVENVLDRYYSALQHFDAKSGDTVVRLTSDCPLIDADIVAACIDAFEEGGYDYLSNVEKRTYPRGLDVEVMTFDALEEAYSYAEEKSEKEHVTPYIRITNRENFHIGSYRSDEDNSKYRITLDEEKDLEAITEIYKFLGCRFDFGYRELIRTLVEHPEIYEINRNVSQKNR